MVGTLGSLRKEALLSEASLFFRFLLSPPALPSARADVEAGTEDWPAGMSPGPLSGLEGLEEENRRWWSRMRTGAAAAADEDKAET